MTSVDISSQDLNRPPDCRCPPVIYDCKGENVLVLRTCSVCMRYALASLRGMCYRRERVGGREVVLVQTDLFSLEGSSPLPGP